MVRLCVLYIYSICVAVHRIPKPTGIFHHLSSLTYVSVKFISVEIFLYDLHLNVFVTLLYTFAWARRYARMASVSCSGLRELLYRYRQSVQRWCNTNALSLPVDIVHIYVCLKRNFRSTSYTSPCHFYVYRIIVLGAIQSTHLCITVLRSVLFRPFLSSVPRTIS